MATLIVKTLRCDVNEGYLFVWHKSAVTQKELIPPNARMGGCDAQPRQNDIGKDENRRRLAECEPGIKKVGISPIEDTIDSTNRHADSTTEGGIHRGRYSFIKAGYIECL